MRFEEVFERYKQGMATEEETVFIEEEIKKAELISNFLLDELGDMDEFRENLDQEYGVGNQDIYKKVKRSIQEKMARVVGISVVIVLVILAIGKYALIPWMNTWYYDPSRAINEYGNKVCELQVDAYTQLHFPGYSFYGADIENIGIGKYEVNYLYQDLFTRSMFSEESIIDKGELVKAGDTYKYPAVNAFVRGTYPFSSNKYWMAGGEYEKEVREELAKLPETSIVNARYSFGRDLSLDEIMTLMDKYKDLQVKWIGVRNAPLNRQRLPLIGMSINEGGAIWTYDKEKYPYLIIRGNEEAITAQVLEKHFKSLVKYMIDYPEFFKTMGREDDHYYDEVLDYVETSGVMSYGISIYTNKDTLLQLMDEEYFGGIQIEHIKVSRYSK